MLANARYTSRDQDAIGRQLAEWPEKGGWFRNRGPSICKEGRYLLTTDSEIEVQGAKTFREVGFVRIRTDERLTGWGVGEVRETLLDSLGNDPFRIGEYVARGLGGAASAEHALWDLLGKATNQPVYGLLGGPFRKEIRMYATVCWPALQDTPIRESKGSVLNRTKLRGG